MYPPPQSPFLVSNRTQFSLVSFKEPTPAGCLQQLEAAGWHLVHVGQTRAVISLGSVCHGVFLSERRDLLQTLSPRVQVGSLRR